MIRANTCPYCGAAYTIADRGCAAKCPMMTLHQRLVDLLIRADVTERDEVERR